MKLAGVSFRIGREPRRRPAGASDAIALADQEDNAGMQQRQLPLGLHLDPYRVPGDGQAASSLSSSHGRIRFLKWATATHA